jgi:hypothetical protein
VASSYAEEGRSGSDDGEGRPDLPFRAGGSEYLAHTEARAELRDRETYYAELRFAVHCQSRSAAAIPAPRTGRTSGTEAESWDEMIARFGDTWT